MAAVRAGVTVTAAVVLLSVVGLPPANANHIAFGEASFAATCKFSHSLRSDPIVFPRQPGAAHAHDFFGNRSTGAFSTIRKLDAADSTCNDPGDKSAYWQPSLLMGGVKQTPARVTAYYILGGKLPGRIKPYPHGLKIVAGDARATRPQPESRVNFGCGSRKIHTRETSPPVQCPAGSTPVARVRFPDCWDGVNLDTITRGGAPARNPRTQRRYANDHKSHMAYSKRMGARHAVCPASHPVEQPQLVLVINWGKALPGFGASPSLSSGSAYSLHADFFNAWRPARMKMLVTKCLNGVEKCRV